MPRSIPTLGRRPENSRPSRRNLFVRRTQPEQMADTPPPPPRYILDVGGQESLVRSTCRPGGGLVSGAKSRTHSPKLRSTGTKAATCVCQGRKPPNKADNPAF